MGERIRSWTRRARLQLSAFCNFVQQAWTSLLAADRGYPALACSGKRSSTFCEILYSKPRQAYWPATVDMPRSLALGSDPANSAIFSKASLDQLTGRLLLVTVATRSSFNLTCSLWPCVEH